MIITTQLVKELRNKTEAGILECKKALEATKGNIKEAITWLQKKRIIKSTKKINHIAAEGLVNIITKGNKTVIFEVNSETDFVAKNKKFLDLITIIGQTLINNELKTIEEALKKIVNDESLAMVIVNAIAIIGEKIILRRFKTLHIKVGQSIGTYLHSNNRIATVLVFNGNIDKTIGKQLAMHVSAMQPQFISRNDIPTNFLNNEKEILITEIKNNPKNFGKSNNILTKMLEGRLNKRLAEILFLEQIFIFNSDQKISDVIKENNVTVVDMIRFEVGEGIKK